MEPERRYCEVRADGRRLTGTAVRYGDVAPNHRETFRAGAFGDVASLDIALTVQHSRSRIIARTGGGGLQLADSPLSLSVAADLPETREADDALTLVRRSVLRGLSIEFFPEDESTGGDGIRVVERAKLVAVSVVDSPAYPASTVQARYGGWDGVEKRRRGFSYRIPYRRTLNCGCHKGSCDRIRINGARVSDRALLVAGNYQRAIASARTGTLKVRVDDDGIELDVPELDATAAGREVVEQLGAVPMVVRPIFRQDASEYVEGADGIADYSRMDIRGFVVGATDADGGWQPVVLDDDKRHDLLKLL